MRVFSGHIDDIETRLEHTVTVRGCIMLLVNTCSNA